MSERTRNYELMFILSPLHASEDEVNAVLERIQNVITTQGGEIVAVNHSSPWGRRKLAYPIRAYAGGEASRRSFTEGYYVLMHFNLEAANMGELERTLKLTDAILRHLITIVENKITLSELFQDESIEPETEPDESEEEEEEEGDTAEETD